MRILDCFKDLFKHRCVIQEEIISIDKIERYKEVREFCDKCGHENKYFECLDGYSPKFDYSLKISKEEIIKRLRERNCFKDTKSMSLEMCCKHIESFHWDYVNEASYPGTNVSYLNNISRVSYLLRRLKEILQKEEDERKIKILDNALKESITGKQGGELSEVKGD